MGHFEGTWQKRRKEALTDMLLRLTKRLGLGGLLLCM
jgi:hypothetical protein